MKTYTFTVIETITREVSYDVSASSEEEALEKAQTGDTEFEDPDTSTESVIDREIIT